MPKQSTNYNWNGFAVGDSVAYAIHGFRETAIIVALEDPVAHAPNLVFDLEVRVLTSPNPKFVGKKFVVASSECKKI